MADGKKPVEFSWKWIVPAIIFAALLTSDSWSAALGIGAFFSVVAFPWMNESSSKDNDTNWIVFIVLLSLALLFGGVYKHHADNREKGVEEEFEYDRDRP